MVDLVPGPGQRSRRGSTVVQAHATKTPSWQVKHSRALIVTDAIAVTLAVVLAHRYRFGDLFWFEPAMGLANSPIFSVIIGLLWTSALALSHSRVPRIIGAGAEEYRQVVRASFFVFGGIGLLAILFKAQLSRSYLMIVLLTGIFLLLLFRWLSRVVISRAREHLGRCVTRLTVVGSEPAVNQLCVSLSRVPWSPYRVVGACIPGSVERVVRVPGFGQIPNFGDESNVLRAVSATASTAVAATATDRLVGSGLGDLSWQLEKHDIEMLVAPGLVDVAGQRLHMRPVAALPLIHVEKPQYHGAKKFKKRFFDVLFSGCVLFCASPILIIIAMAVKLTSRGPVFYRSERIGLDGRPFKMLKFRTMVQGADAMISDLTGLDLVASPRDPFKFRNDPRVTGVGVVLRKYSLDELPQFINVIQGNMSVVGPRPQVLSEVNAYDDQARRRLLVRPGITGLWQVNGRSDLSWEDSVRLDLFYVENWSMTADFLISLRTLKAILKHTGAY
jgi:exopolysaccharide biosynthesis polyprenyl glycosylphosphotransferase